MGWLDYVKGRQKQERPVMSTIERHKPMSPEEAAMILYQNIDYDVPPEADFKSRPMISVKFNLGDFPRDRDWGYIVHRAFDKADLKPDGGGAVSLVEGEATLFYHEFNAFRKHKPVSEIFQHRRAKQLSGVVSADAVTPAHFAAHMSPKMFAYSHLLIKAVKDVQQHKQQRQDSPDFPDTQPAERFYVAPPDDEVAVGSASMHARGVNEICYSHVEKVNLLPNGKLEVMFRYGSGLINALNDKFPYFEPVQDPSSKKPDAVDSNYCLDGFLTVRLTKTQAKTFRREFRTYYRNPPLVMLR